MELIVQKIVECVLRAHDLFYPVRKLLVACSGGTDSLALLDALDILYAAGGAQLICAHYEHGIRGADSLADARFVEAFCAMRGIPFVLEAGDVPAYARMHKCSLETAARICRYDFLYRVCDERKCDAIVLAHHADDLAETVLMRILRGTGPAGLAAMRERDGLYLRPLLTVMRAEVEAYAVKRGLMPRHDATNDAMDARRNRIRHELLPELARTYNPAVRDALTRLSALAAEEDDLLAELAEDAYTHALCVGGLSIPALRALHPALQRRALRIFWMWETGAAQDFSYLHEERMRALLAVEGTARIEMQGGWYAAARCGVLSLLRPAQESVQNKEIRLSFTCEYVIINFQGIQFEFRRLSRMTADDWVRMARREAVYADCAQLPPLVLRTRRAGDYIRLPIGRKKLKEILIDDKVPRERRDSIPLIALADTQEIFWIAGGRRSCLAQVAESSRDIMKIECVKETTTE